MMGRYVVVGREVLSDFEEIVNKRVAEGYVPLGGLTVIPYSYIDSDNCTAHYNWYWQALHLPVTVNA